MRKSVWKPRRKDITKMALKADSQFIKKGVLWPCQICITPPSMSPDFADFNM